MFIFQNSSLHTEFGHAHIYIRFLMRKYLAVIQMSNGFLTRNKTKLKMKMKKKNEMLCGIDHLKYSRFSRSHELLLSIFGQHLMV